MWQRLGRGEGLNTKGGIKNFVGDGTARCPDGRGSYTNVLELYMQKS